ncbi:RNA polymerase sigma factor [Leadbetterella byssophila]|uniref:RNA polymerase, sigma-24 subunit, ECF subfamily n=1 Tax=Leadbetterella byssophila (strain DSM 17132 / JCM 16389 / KACC 11308 / NBRC 106382 / 4M15) TaxID=649349 RepID=E4RT18_LEAB4|nr:RNA polymerase sigma factor [Leadbetterella byssophila]ADQ17726.1 RNA polymerase, sigma-24 subunit, ECF subfamily [Leadbetterella byssophila DSM 17132]
MKSSKYTSYKDEELVSLYITSQKNEYFEEIYERYANKVYRKCYSFVYNQEKAEDLTHDIFLKLIVKIGTYKETSKFSTWLYSITYNYCMDQIRTRKKKTEVPLPDQIDISDEDDADFLDFQSAELEKSLKQMPSEERAILQMKYQEDFSIKEIAETMKISESAVKMRLLRSKEKLKKYYLENITVFVLIVMKILSLFEK